MSDKKEIFEFVIGISPWGQLNIIKLPDNYTDEWKSEFREDMIETCEYTDIFKDHKPGVFRVKMQFNCWNCAGPQDFPEYDVEWILLREEIIFDGGERR